MPLPFLSLPQFPNVPQVLGVPPVIRFPNLPTLPSIPSIPDIPSILGLPTIPSLPTLQSLQGLMSPITQYVSIDGPDLPTDKAKTIWGIFDKAGQPVITVDSIVGVDFMNEYRVSDYPVEEGAFQSYNKVATPFDARIIMTKGGNDNDRTTFLIQLVQIIQSLALFDVVTPELIYQNVNIVHYDYSRHAKKGATLITAEVWVREIRVQATAQFTKTASAADPQNVGTVQPQQLDAPQVAATLPWSGSGGTASW